MAKYMPDGQVGLFDPFQCNGCRECICRDCMHWWKSDCPHGRCYDDRRAIENPYITAHGGAVRKGWSAWDKPGEQGHWCRGSYFYATLYCESYVRYKGQRIEPCLGANIRVFQDGSIRCPVIECWGCEFCYDRFMRDVEVVNDDQL